MSTAAQFIGNIAIIFIMFIPTYLDILGWVFLQPETFYQKLVLIIIYIALSPLQGVFLVLGIAALFSVNR